MKEEEAEGREGSSKKGEGEEEGGDSSDEFESRKSKPVRMETSPAKEESVSNLESKEKGEENPGES